MAAPGRKLDESLNFVHEPKKARLNCNDSNLQSFLTWCGDGGLILSAKVRVGTEGSCAQYGMVATSDIAAGECLFEVPRSLLLHPETCAISQLLREESYALRSKSGWVPLLVALLHEYTNPASRWRHYIHFVPDYDQLDLPMFWPKCEVQQDLTGTGVGDAVAQDLSSIQKEFHEIVLPFVQKHANKFPAECQDVELYKKMVAFVMAYSFSEPVVEADDEDSDDEGVGEAVKPPPMMVPMADILNHVAKNNAHLDFGRDSLKMVSIKPIKAGEEVYNTYGQVPNSHLLHMYGFAESFPANHYDTVNIPMRKIPELYAGQAVEKDRVLFDAKWNFLQELGVVVDDGSFVLGVDGVMTEEDMHQTLKVVLMDLASFEEYLEKDGWSDDEEDSPGESLANEDIPKLPACWRSLLKGMAKSCLSDYLGTIADEETVLNDPARWRQLSQRQQFAVHVRFGQMQLLQRLVRLCGETDS